MNQAKLYSKYNDFQRHTANQLIQKWTKLTKFESTDVMADLGCGTGDITRSLLLKQIPCAHIVAIDVSQSFLKFATEQNTDPLIEYHCMDLGCKEVPKQYLTRFDHAFSSFVFHWIPDQRQLFNNAYQMLKPGGDLMATFVVKSDIMSIFEQLVKTKNWNSNKALIRDMCPYKNCKNPLKALEALAEESGFFYEIEVEGQNYIYDSTAHLKSSIAAITPFFNNIPKQRYEEYMNDIMKLAVDLNLIPNQLLPNDKVSLRHDLATLFLRKPVSSKF